MVESVRQRQRLPGAPVARKAKSGETNRHHRPGRQLRNARHIERVICKGVFPGSCSVLALHTVGRLHRAGRLPVDRNLGEIGRKMDAEEIRPRAGEIRWDIEAQRIDVGAGVRYLPGVGRTGVRAHARIEDRSGRSAVVRINVKIYGAVPTRDARCRAGPANVHGSAHDIRGGAQREIIRLDPHRGVVAAESVRRAAVVHHAGVSRARRQQRNTRDRRAFYQCLHVHETPLCAFTPPAPSRRAV